MILRPALCNLRAPTKTPAPTPQQSSFEQPSEPAPAHKSKGAAVYVNWFDITWFG